MGKADAETNLQRVDASLRRDTDADLEKRTSRGCSRAEKPAGEGGREGIGGKRNGESSLDAVRRQRKPSVLPRFSKILEFISGSLSSRTAGKWSKFHPVRTRGYSAVGYLSVVSRALRPTRPSITPFSRSYTTIYHVTKNLLCTRA